jgi:phosphohistidine phosphatase SixA
MPAPKIESRDDRSRDIDRSEASKQLLDFVAEDIETSLVAKNISTLLFMTSPWRRTTETAEYVVNSLQEFGRVTHALVETELLGLDSDLGGDVPDVRNGKRAAVEDFAAYVDRMVETSDTGVIVVTHEPVIRAIGIISGLDSADIHSDEIGEITIVK